jgi:ferredoxin
MIITKQKNFKELLILIGKGPVFIIGCSECATICHTGGEKEVIEMNNTLNDKNIEVTGWTILEPACNLLNDKRILRNYKKEIKKAKKILVLACGNGVQTISEIFKETDIISGTDTLFLGEIKHIDEFEKRCEICGDCIIDFFGGLCPISRCPKNMLNGPCGGSKNGKCEVDNNMDCIWNLIYKRLSDKGRFQELKDIRNPIDWSKSTIWRRDV